MTLRRVVRDKRSAVVPLVVLALANLGVYLLGVAPLRARVAAAEGRAAQVSAEVRAAAAQFEQTRVTVEGRGKATEQLERFYREVLPADQAAARRLTYFDLARLARSAGLRVNQRTQALAEDRDSQLVRLDASMVVEGRYDDLREFIYDIETASDFIVITDVVLTQGEKDSAALLLTLGLSTYFHPKP
jgi:Tfp pilus assembly protein PilO